jgi:endo-1,4-beta-mannosidase
VWKQFDADATRRDFARMKEMGVNCVRVFLSYGSFCSTAGKLDADGIAKFDQFLAIAEGTGIYVHPTGPDHWEGLPQWASVDRIADERALVGLESFWREFAARYRERTVIFAYDLRNEPEVAWDTPPMRERWRAWTKAKYGSVESVTRAWALTNSTLAFENLQPPKSGKAPEAELLDYQLFREGVADEWTERQVKAIKAVDPKALISVGLVQWSVPSCIVSPEHYAAFRPERQAKFLDFLEIHFYPFDHGVYEYRDEEDEGRNLAYLESVVRETARFGKPVVVAEFGWYGGGKPKFDEGRHPFATEDQQARWCQRLVESTAGLATGWLNWGFYDQPEAGDCSEFTGLLTAEGKVKAWGRAFKNLSARYSGEKFSKPNLELRPDLDWNKAVIDPAFGNRYRRQYFEAWKKAFP